MQVGPCIPMGTQVQKAEVGPTSGPTWRLSHFVEGPQLFAQLRPGHLCVPRQHEEVQQPDCGDGDLLAAGGPKLKFTGVDPQISRLTQQFD